MKCLKPLWPLGPLNRPALGVILSRDARFGQGVEQGGFANVGQTHDAAFQTHKNILVNQNPSCISSPYVIKASAQEHKKDRNLGKPEISVLALS